MGCTLISTAAVISAFACKNQLSDDKLFLYACGDYIESIPESDPATVSDLCLDSGLISSLTSLFFVLMLTSPHLALSLSCYPTILQL